jgi:hypothetical protein
LVWSWFDFQRTSTNCLMRSDPASWLAASAVRAKQANVRLAIRILLYSWWNVWKEIFESTQRSEFQVACAVMEDVYGDVSQSNESSGSRSSLLEPCLLPFLAGFFSLSYLFQVI